MLSVNSFLQASQDAIRVFDKIYYDADMSDVLTLRRSSHQELNYLEVRKNIIELEIEANKLVKLQDIASLFYNVDALVPPHRGVLNAANRGSRFSPQKFLIDIRNFLSEWICEDGKNASQMRCPKGNELCNIANEIIGFENAGDALSLAGNAGDLLLEHPEELFFKQSVIKNLNKVQDFYDRELNPLKTYEETEHGYAVKDAEFAKEKRRLYEINYDNLKNYDSFIKADQGSDFSVEITPEPNSKRDQIAQFKKGLKNWLTKLLDDYDGNKDIYSMAREALNKISNEHIEIKIVENIFNSFSGKVPSVHLNSNRVESSLLILKKELDD